MDLFHALTTFNRIVETGSFSAAARDGNAGVSAVTRLIGNLEAHFGVRLFHRSTRSLTLTEDGQQLLTYARQMIETAEEMSATMSRQHRTPTGLVRVGLPAGAARLLVPRLRELLERHPGLAVELLVGDRFDNLVEERLDLVIQGGTVTDASLVTRTVGSAGRIVVAAPSYFERRGVPMRPADLAGHSCIVHRLSPDSASWRFDGPEGHEAIEVTGSLQANDSEIVRQAALAGHGIALLPNLMVLEDVQTGRLVQVLPDWRSETRTIAVVYPSRRHLPPRTRAVIDFLIGEFRARGEHIAQYSADEAIVTEAAGAIAAAAWPAESQS